MNLIERSIAPCSRSHQHGINCTLCWQRNSPLWLGCVYTACTVCGLQQLALGWRMSGSKEKRKCRGNVRAGMKRPRLNKWDRHRKRVDSGRAKCNSSRPFSVAHKCCIRSAQCARSVDTMEVSAFSALWIYPQPTDTQARSHTVFMMRVSINIPPLH